MNRGLQLKHLDVGKAFVTRAPVTMLQFLLLAVIGASVCRGQEQSVTASFSGLYGGTYGNEFSGINFETVGPITGMKIWTGSLTLHGIQVCYGNVWSNLNGAAWGTMVEMYLESNESIVEVQGSYTYWVITSLTFTTSLGRTFVFGNQSGSTFLSLPQNQGAVLRAISGRASSYLNAIGFHWGAYPTKVVPCSA